VEAEFRAIALQAAGVYDDAADRGNAASRAAQTRLEGKERKATLAPTGPATGRIRWLCAKDPQTGEEWWFNPITKERTRENPCPGETTPDASVMPAGWVPEKYRRYTAPAAPDKAEAPTIQSRHSKPFQAPNGSG